MTMRREARIAAWVSVPLGCLCAAALAVAGVAAAKASQRPVVEPYVRDGLTLSGTVEKKDNGYFYLDFERDGTAGEAPLDRCGVSIGGLTPDSDEQWADAMALLVGEGVTGVGPGWWTTDLAHKYFDTDYRYPLINDVYYGSVS
jgi:hypothetical protein